MNKKQTQWAQPYSNLVSPALIEDKAEHLVDA